MSLSFQDLIFKLKAFWGRQGCAILEPYDLEMGAGTFHWATTLKTLGKEPWNAAFVQPSRRPSDGRYGENPNRLQAFHQFQVILKPSPLNSQELYLESLKEIGFSLTENDIRFVEDDWESPTLGASGLGWEVWCNGQEISQFTYFQYMGSLPCDPVSVELTYGLERIALILQGKNSVYELNWNGGRGDQEITYGDIFLRREKEFSAFNFEFANTNFLLKGFEDAECETRALLEKGLVTPAYDYCVKASHIFNLLDARGKISVVERAAYIARVRDLARACCEAWVASQEPLK
ncbi:MAG: glycine--tRNA ligase subunit alpha [Proteobacteria bacterium]|nr:glycine--tRNA ligase subunit alpha [Pseudomonadota bacterium]